MGKKRSPSARWRWLAALLLVLLVAGGFAWWHIIHWTPPRSEFPVQGVEIGMDDGRADFTALRAIGADFVYLEASNGENSHDLEFARNLAAALAAGLQVGAVHAYDPCLAAEKQSANFVTVVPRDAGLLPPAIALDKLADDCPERVSDAMVESELTTFLNQIEGHAGKPAVLKISSGFEARYGLAHRVGRGLWLSRTRFQPDYGGRPWTLWTANAMLRSDASAYPLRWVVLQP